MSFDVDIQKVVGGERRRFSLAVRFRTQARRTVIYGPSGAGKTLTLQAIAGLLRPDSGRIAFGSEVVYEGNAGIDVPARQRDFGFLFQDYALFPKLSVRQNVAFGLSKGLRNPGERDGGEAVERWLHTFELMKASGSAWRWPARSSTRRAPCSSTSPSPRSIPSCASACAPSSTSCSSAPPSRC